MKRLTMVFITVLLATAISGCVATPKMPQFAGDPSNPLKRVAILPMTNNTNDVEGPNIVRARLIDAFQKRCYNVKPVEEVDKLLRDQMGITLGGQLEMASLERIKEVLDVEGVVFGTLIDFSFVTTGVYNVRKVRAIFKLVNTTTGDTFWENGKGVKCDDSSGGLLGAIVDTAADVKDAKAGKEEGIPWVEIQCQQGSKDQGIVDGLAWALAEKVFTKATKTQLQRETSVMIDHVTQTLPWGPGTATAVSARTTPATASQGGFPRARMPMVPFYGQTDYGDRDFSAVMVSTCLDKVGSNSVTCQTPIAKAGGNTRLETDYTELFKGFTTQPTLNKMVNINREDLGVSYTLYPMTRKYLVHDVNDKNFNSMKPDIERTKVGEEIVDGYLTEKFKVKIGYKQVQISVPPIHGHIWNAKDLGGMTIKSEIEDAYNKITTEMKNIVLEIPSEHLFEVPADYTKANNMMEIMGAVATRK